MARLRTHNCHLKTCLTATLPTNKPNCHSNFIPTKQLCLSVLQRCSSMNQLTQIHAYIFTSGLYHDQFLHSELVKFCALSPSGGLDYARCLLDHAIDPLICSWNSLLRGYSQSNSPKEAIFVYSQMRIRGIKPNKLTFPSVLKACSCLSLVFEGKQVQVVILKSCFDSHIPVGNTLIHFYASCGDVLSARQVFDEMPVRSIVSWNAVISGYIRNCCLEEAMNIFIRMRATTDFEPDEATMVILLSACAKFGDMNLGKWVHCYVIEKGIHMNLQLGTALVDMYAKCGSIDYAQQMFDKMSERNVWTWSAMILGLAQHGLAKKALDLFDQMKNSSIKPNYVTFLGVLCACTHAGFVDDGCRLFDEMIFLYGIKPMMLHYGAMVDMLGRAGYLEEAYRFVESMPMEPDAVVWRTLLGSCTIHHDAHSSSEIREKVKDRLLEMEPKRCGNYVIVSNIYAEIGMWGEMANMRRMMREEGMKKMAGESSVQVGASIFRFMSGDDACINSEAVYQLLNGLNAHIKMSTE